MSQIPKSIVRFYHFAVIAAVCALCGCAAIPRVHENSLTQIYAQKRSQPKKNPPIFIHGILGSVLDDPSTGRILWGRSFEGSLEKLSLPIEGATLLENRDELNPETVVEYFSWFGFLKKDIYYRAAKVAITAGGYVPDKDSFVLVYDWRRDLVEAAAQLDELIESIRKQTGKSDLKFTLVCHSMGGMVARYYIKYGREDVLGQDPLPQPTFAGAKKIDKVIMLGVPNCGAMEAFERLHRGLWIPTIGRALPETTFTMPALYYLMPFGSEPLFTDIKGNLLDVDIYDAANWEKYGWSVFDADRQRMERERLSRKHGDSEGKRLFNAQVERQKVFLKLVLARAKKFHEALWNGDPLREKEHVKYILLGADSQRTLQRALLTQKDSRYLTKFNAQGRLLKDILFGFGDGSVTRESLLGVGDLRMPSDYEIFIAQEHAQLADDPTYLDNILHILLD